MKKLIGTICIAVALFISVSVAQEGVLFRIGTGGAGGTYFPIGGAIAMGLSNPVGARECDNGGQCGVLGMISVAQSTTASVFNNKAVHNSKLEAGLAAADVTRSMYLGIDQFKGERYEHLRVIANLYPENLHLVLREGVTIKTLDDLRGKRVGIAEAGSGTQVAALQILKEWKITRDDIDAVELSSSDNALQIANNSLDAFFSIAGWPVKAITNLSNASRMQLYSFSEAEVDKIIKLIPSFVPSSIPGGTYYGIDTDVRTPAVNALLVTSSRITEDMGYDVTRALWNRNTRKLLDRGHHKGKFITLDNALVGLDNLGVPLHRGALKYYQEIGKL